MTERRLGQLLGNIRKYTNPVSLLGMAANYSPDTQRLLGPIAGAVQNAPKLLEYVGPQADVNDMVNYSRATSEAFRNKDYLGTLANMGLLGAAVGMTALPGSVGGVDDAVDAAKKSVDDLSYRGNHTAPVRDGYSAPLHDLAGNIYPDDIYSANAAQYYGHYGGNHPMDVETAGILRRYKGKPNATVTVYRAVPYEPSPSEMVAKLEDAKRAYQRRGNMPKWAIENGYQTYDDLYDAVEQFKAKPDAPAQSITLNPGDWVTVNKRYAKEHGESQLGGKYKIVSKKVKASDLFTDGNSIHEFGYSPE